MPPTVSINYLATESVNLLSLSSLPTLQVLKESLRLYPPATGTVREAPADCVFNGFKISRGTAIVVRNIVNVNFD